MKDDLPNPLADAFAKGLELPRNRKLNAVEDALSVPTTYLTDGEWAVIGPTLSGAYAIKSGKRQLAVVQAVDVPPVQAIANARCMVRAGAMFALLEHIQTELQSDDEGQRWKDLLDIIGKELRTQRGK